MTYVGHPPGPGTVCGMCQFLFSPRSWWWDPGELTRHSAGDVRPSEQVRIAAQYLRERLTRTQINLGIANVTLGELRRSGKIALDSKLFWENFVIFLKNFRSNKKSREEERQITCHIKPDRMECKRTFCCRARQTLSKESQSWVSTGQFCDCYLLHLQGHASHTGTLRPQQSKVWRASNLGLKCSSLLQLWECEASLSERI